MLSKYKWYRKLRGGYWVYIHFVGWDKVCPDLFEYYWVNRQFMSNNHLESYIR